MKTRAVLLLFVCLFAGADTIAAQTPRVRRQFVFEDKRSNDPVQLLGFRVAGTLMDADAQFEATDTEWLKDATMVVKNISKKEIVALWVMLAFPETGASSPPVADQIRLGNPPPEGTYSATGEKLNLPPQALLSLQPNQTLEIPLGQHYQELAPFLAKRRPLAELSVCHVRFASVYFSNGMKWSPNYFGKPDPDHVGRYPYTAQ